MGVVRCLWLEQYIQRMAPLSLALLAACTIGTALAQNGQQGFVDSLRAQGFTDAQINGFLASQQNRPEPQQAAPQPQQQHQRSKASFRISAGNEDYGTITMELFDEVVPRTVANFVALASGQNRLVVSLSMAGSLTMRISASSTLHQVSSPWQTLVPTLTEPSSSSPQWRPPGWTGSMWCSAGWTTRRASMWSKGLRPWGPGMGSLLRLSPSQTPELSSWDKLSRANPK